MTNPTIDQIDPAIIKLLTAEAVEKLIENGRKQEPVRGTEQEIDFVPVVKLFDPCGGGCWLLTEIYPDNPEVAFGLVDLGWGAELGDVSLAELAAFRSGLLRGTELPLERDRYWRAEKTLKGYAREARKAGYLAA